MALLERVGRLFAADVHAVLDQLEEPEIVLKQAIREMEEDLAQQLQRCKWLAKEIETSGTRIDELETAEREIEDRLEICFDNDNDELARRVVRRRIETRRHRERLVNERRVLEEALAEQEAVVAANRDRLDSLRQKAALVSDASARGEQRAACDRVDDDEVEIEFLRAKQARAPS